MLLATLILAVSVRQIFCLDIGGIGKTPFMGWNSWNAYKADINESSIKETVDLMVSLGLRDAGYEYVTLDAGWSSLTRTADGKRQAHPDRFPSGIRVLSDYVHSQGMKIGIYSDAGLLDCSFAPGSYGYEDEDVATWTEWGIDLLKYDNCGGFHANIEPPQVRFGRMRDAIIRSGSTMLYSLCEWGYQFPWFWADKVGHTYRMSGDINAFFGDEEGHTDCPCATTAYCLNTGYAGCSVLAYIRKMREITQFQKPYSFADMDMFEIGQIANETLGKTRTHFAFWAALKSPMVLGTNLANLGKDKVAVVTSKAVIAVNQDGMGTSASYIAEASVEKTSQVWSGPLEGAAVVVLLFNETPSPQRLSVDLALLGVNSSATVLDLWTSESWTADNGSISIADVEPWDTRILKVSQF